MQERGRAERHQAQGAQGTSRWVKDTSRVVVLLLPSNQESNQQGEQRGDSPVLVMHDGVTKSVFPLWIPAKGVDVASCEKVKMIIKELDTLGHYRVVFRCDSEPSILVLTAVECRDSRKYPSGADF